MEIKFEPTKINLIDVSYFYKKNNNTKFLIYVSLTNFIDSFLCFLNNFEKLTYMVIAPGPSIDV